MAKHVIMFTIWRSRDTGLSGFSKYNHTGPYEKLWDFGDRHREGSDMTIQAEM